ncbi:MAG: methylated-DNA--[protein]-cysteine S-methyltransferase [Rhodanobacteraceae bacterium]|nr:MAG: methylated-DNA--[protein]-cysteine S-methyltransferase [Rhodanobacteraceae bacterium]
MRYYDSIATPIGPLLLVSDGEGLVELGLPERGKLAKPPADAQPSTAKLRTAARQLHEYFAGTRLQFDLPLHPSGTAFQLEVWGALLTIPYGETASYKDIAQRIRRPRAVRAVGAANGANPLAIIVPCHRVIGSHGDLVGYGGGLPIKRWLLAHERRFAPVPKLALTA